MPNDVFHVRADMVDESFWIETSATRAATVQIHATLELARMPGVWMPRFCLVGPEGSGKSALARRVVKQAQRNVACRLDGALAARGEAPRYSGPSTAASAAEAMARARAVAADFGHCPRICAPIGYQHLDLPIDLRDMALKPTDNPYHGLVNIGLPTPGDEADDPLRRTSLVLVDEADRLLNISEAKRRRVLSVFDDRAERYTFVFIGGPELARALARHGTTQLIPLPGLAEGPEFSGIVEKVFGTRDAGAVARLHEATKGCMGPLLHVAALEGLEAPYGFQEREVARLPPPRTA